MIIESITLNKELVIFPPKKFFSVEVTVAIALRLPNHGDVVALLGVVSYVVCVSYKTPNVGIQWVCTTHD